MAKDHRHRPRHHELVRRRSWKAIPPGSSRTREGARTTPSIVAYQEDGEVLVGASAKRQAVTNPKNTLYAVKRLIGRKFDREGSAEGHRPDALHHRRGRQRRRLGRSARQEARASAGQRRGAAQDEEDRRGLSRRGGDRGGHHRAGLLQRQPAPGHQGRRPHRGPGRQAHHQRAHRRGPGLRPGQARTRATARSPCIDLGGGTFDISIIEIADVDGEKQFEVLSTNGDTFLGGEDFDQRIIDYIISRVQEGARASTCRKDVLALQRLKEAAEKAKIELSNSAQTDINLPYITADAIGPEAPEHQAHARQARSPGRRPDRAHHRALPHRHQGRRRQGRRDPAT